MPSSLPSPRPLRLRRFRVLPWLATALLLAPGCSKRSTEAVGAAPTSSAAPSAEAPKAGRIGWSDPLGWVKNPPSNPMRVAQYTIAHADTDTEDAECVVTTFGPGQGGSVDSNIDRWVRQFDPKGQSGGTRDERRVAGLRVTTVEVEGTYKGMAMPGGPAPKDKPHARMLGAIVETPSGLWFFKLTGPDATVRLAAPGFRSLLDSLHL